jgi:AmiR/NasT family two-component response regulator
MTSLLVLTNGPAASHSLALDLDAVGMKVLAWVSERSKLVQEVLRQAPDLVLCYDPLPTDELFNALQIINDTAPCPVIVFTTNSDAEKIARATEVGVHAYVVSGYAQHRLRPLIHLAQARFKREQSLRAEMRDISSRFEERKMVDRAKGILMRARQVSDDDAFQILRTVSMHSNQRLGQVSQHIIHSAHFAEAVNRSGQLRMLSQRIVKLHLLQLAGMQAATCGQQLAESTQRVDANLALLGKSLSKATFGDLLGQVVLTWGRLKHELQGKSATGPAAVYGLVDNLAEQLLQEAERLTSNLESGGAVPRLHVLNVAGRQRMLSQRFAKYALLGVLGDGSPALTELREAGMAESGAAFEQAMAYLKGLPLSSQEIRTGLEQAGALWEQLQASAGEAKLLSNRKKAAADRTLEQLAGASEGLLEVFERLSTHYESSMQMLVGS